MEELCTKVASRYVSSPSVHCQAPPWVLTRRFPNIRGLSATVCLSLFVIRFAKVHPWPQSVVLEQGLESRISRRVRGNKP